MTPYAINLSWPARALWQNEKCHWRIKGRTRAAQRKEAWALGREAELPKSPDARLTFTFCPPDRRRRDRHNMPETMKGAIDGIADAMGVDDEFFDVRYADAWGPIVEGGQVRVVIEPRTIEVPFRGQVT